MSAITDILHIVETRHADGQEGVVIMIWDQGGPAAAFLGTDAMHRLRFRLDSAISRLEVATTDNHIE